MVERKLEFYIDIDTRKNTGPVSKQRCNCKRCQDNEKTRVKRVNPRIEF